MMISNKLKKIVQEIKKTDTEFEITPEELFSFFNFGKRTKANQHDVDEFLNDNQLEVVPRLHVKWCR
jgi:hypothetical protein